VQRLLVLVCAIVLVDTAFYAVVVPLLPELEDELGLSKAQAGVLTGAFAAGTLAGALPSGLLAARVGPRRVVILGLSLLAGSSLVFGLVRELVVLDLARFVQGLGSACSWAGAMAWLIGAAPPDRRGALIGTALGAAIAGSLLGPVLGALASAAGQAATFAGVAGVGVLLLGLALREPAPPPGTTAQGTAMVRRVLALPVVRAGMWMVALPALGFGVLNVLVPLRLDALGASQAAVAAAFLAAAAGEASVSPLAGRLSDRRGRLAPMRIGLTGGAVLVALVVLPASVLAVTLLLVAATAALGTFWAPAMALLSDAADGAGLHQGPAFALVNLAWASGATAGATGGGALADATGDLVPLLLVAALCALTLAWLPRARAATAPAGP
jgi:MFS family permease